MYDKATIIVKPTQSGKTFQMLLGIVSFFKAAVAAEVRRIQLIFVDNNLILANQTAARVGGCEWFEDGENEYLMFSSKSKTSDAAKIECEITDPFREQKVSNIIMCANNARFKDTETIIARLAINFPTILFDLWIDESDKAFSSPKHTALMNRLCSLSNVASVTLLTATPGANLRQFGEINVIPMENSINIETYSSWEKAQIIQIESETSNTIEYAASVIDSHPDAFQIGTRSFIPADTYIDTHEEMSSMLVKRGFAVLVINGTGCDIRFKYGKKRPKFVRQGVAATLHGYFGQKYANGLSDIQASEWIADIYESLELSSFPFAITGNLCIGRGTTLSSPKMFINRAILPPKGPKNRSSKELNLARMYQLAGRVTGNTMEFAVWEPPMVFCTPMFDECIKTMETRAKRLSEVAYDSGNTAVNTEIYETIAKAPMTASEVKQKIKDEELELKGTVPTILTLTSQEITDLLKKTGKEKEEYLYGVIMRYNLDLWMEIISHTCIKISQPGKDHSEEARNKYIDAPISKAINGIKWKVDISQAHNENDVWLAYVDSVGNRVIVSVWNGTKCRQLV